MTRRNEPEERIDHCGSVGKLTRGGEVVDGGPHEIILIEASIDTVELSLIPWIEPVEGTRRRLQKTRRAWLQGDVVQFRN